MFFLLAALLVVCTGAQFTEAAAAPRPINSCQTIDESGSYVLSRNLTAAGHCLVLAADNVTIDLDGHTITGNGTGNGIWFGDATRQNITIRNGVITNFGNGIDLSGLIVTKQGSVVERIHAVQNTDAGIRTASNSIVRDNIANGNGTYGILVLGESLVVGNVANYNGQFGIAAACPSNIIGNTATYNRFENIRAIPIVGGAGPCTLNNNNPAP